jgi:hypothetical protein
VIDAKHYIELFFNQPTPPQSDGVWLVLIGMDFMWDLIPHKPIF